MQIFYRDPSYRLQIVDYIMKLEFKNQTNLIGHAQIQGRTVLFYRLMNIQIRAALNLQIVK
jgi:hypothetical protein